MTRDASKNCELVIEFQSTPLEKGELLQRNRAEIAPMASQKRERVCHIAFGDKPPESSVPVVHQAHPRAMLLNRSTNGERAQPKSTIKTRAPMTT